MNSNETAAGYRPQVGDTVRLPGSDQGEIRVTAVGEDNFLGRAINGGHECGFTLAPSAGRSWVKVEPTPADRYVLFRADGSQVPAHSESAHSGRFRAGNLDHCFPKSAPHRVARFSFAGWVDAEAEQ